MVQKSSALLALCCATALAGCYVSTRREPVSITSAEVVPSDIESYPSTMYDGHVVYLYGDRWYYEDRGVWRTYENPPPALVRQRRYVQQAPAARPGAAEPIPYRAPSPAPGAAPPAQRVP